MANDKNKDLIKKAHNIIASLVMADAERTLRDELRLKGVKEPYGKALDIFRKGREAMELETLTTLGGTIPTSVLEEAWTQQCVALRGALTTDIKAAVSRLLEKDDIYQALVKEGAAPDRKNLVLTEAHAEGVIDDPCRVLVEVDRHTGDMNMEEVDSIEFTDEGFRVETENGWETSRTMYVDELIHLRDELSAIEEDIDNPDGYLMVKGFRVRPREDED
jgi:hypothetical protein